jgi:nucleotide-binding universal stress UspA family protein
MSSSTHTGIVLLDLSVQSDILMAYVNEIHAQQPCKWVLLHQLSSLVPTFADKESKTDLMLSEQTAALAKLSAYKQQYLAHAEAECVAWPHPIVQFINKYEASDNDTFVLAGMQSSGILKQWLVGSTATRVIEESNLPVILLPAMHQPHAPAYLSIAVHPNFDVNEGQLKQILAMWSQSLKGIEFVCLAQKNESTHNLTQYLYDWQARYAGYKPSIFLYDNVKVTDGLYHHMQERSHTMLVLQQGSRNLTDKLFRKLVVNELIYEAEISLIVLST